MPPGAVEASVLLQGGIDGSFAPRRDSRPRVSDHGHTQRPSRALAAKRRPLVRRICAISAYAANVGWRRGGYRGDARCFPVEMNGSEVNETFPEHHWQSDDDPSASDSSDMSSSETSGRPRTPPLRIHHILILTAVAAVLLSVTHLLRQQDYLNLSQMFSSSWGAVFTITIAIDVTLVMLGFAWRRRGYAFFDMPGHWLLLTHSL